MATFSGSIHNRVAVKPTHVYTLSTNIQRVIYHWALKDQTFGLFLVWVCVYIYIYIYIKEFWGKIKCLKIYIFMDWEKRKVPFDHAQCISWQTVLWSLCLPQAIPLRSSQTLDISHTRTFLLFLFCSFYLILRKRYLMCPK